MGDQLMESNDKLIHYSLQLTYLAELLKSQLISENEYAVYKKKLMKDYGVVSDILANENVFS